MVLQDGGTLALKAIIKLPFVSKLVTLHRVLTTRDAMRFQRQAIWLFIPDAMQKRAMQKMTP